MKSLPDCFHMRKVPTFWVVGLVCRLPIMSFLYLLAKLLAPILSTMCCVGKRNVTSIHRSIFIQQYTCARAHTHIYVKNTDRALDVDNHLFSSLHLYNMRIRANKNVEILTFPKAPQRVFFLDHTAERGI